MSYTYLNTKYLYINNANVVLFQVVYYDILDIIIYHRFRSVIKGAHGSICARSLGWEGQRMHIKSFHWTMGSANPNPTFMRTLGLMASPFVAGAHECARKGTVGGVGVRSINFLQVPHVRRNYCDAYQEHPRHYESDRDCRYSYRRDL